MKRGSYGFAAACLNPRAIREALRLAGLLAGDGARAARSAARERLPGFDMTSMSLVVTQKLLVWTYFGWNPWIVQSSGATSAAMWPVRGRFRSTTNSMPPDHISNKSDDSTICRLPARPNW
jgi:hypothetical protein